ncbi:MAG TPA: ECF transporter S component, partial [Ornithinibacter sp.]|nr:ECF transporter S component [Ornithinibacter sp.]
MATQITREPRSSTRRSITATRPLRGWRTVDIITIAFLGAALGVAFWGWGVFYNGPVTALKIGYAPLMGLFVGPWFLAGVIGGLVVRRPGAALFC